LRRGSGLCLEKRLEALAPTRAKEVKKAKGNGKGGEEFKRRNLWGTITCHGEG